MVAGASDNPPIRVGGLGESMSDWIITLPSAIARKTLVKHGMRAEGVQFIADLELLLHLGRELEEHGQSVWAAGDPVSNTLHTMGVCQESRAMPLSLYWFGTVGTQVRGPRFGHNPIDSLRRAAIIPYCVAQNRPDGLALCVVASESHHVMTIAAHSTTSRPAVDPDWPAVDILIMMMRSLADRDEAMDKFVAACRFLALIVGDGLSIDRQWLAFFQELSASGKLRWICGTAAELARLGLFHLHGVHPTLCSVEIVATQGTDAVLVWDPGAKRIVTLEVPVVTSVTGDDIGAGDAYAGGYLHSRILNRSIKDAHAVAATCAKRVLKVSGARVEAESDLNRVFGHLTDRASEAHDEGKLYDRVRITPGITVISGGQTGVDQIGLCAATQLGLPAFGVLPQGRRTEVTEGIIAGPDDFCDSYIVELRSASYRYRTWVTAFLADGTLIWDFHGSEGSAATRTACQTLGRPLLDLAAAESSSLLPEVIRWADRHAIRVLNIAGNRGSLISGREHTHVETDLNSILKSLAWRRAQRSTTGQPRQRPEPATGTGKVGAAGYSGLRIGFPNVPPQLALLGQFLLETAGVRLPQSRRLVIPIDELKITFALARPRDLPAMLRDRLIDLIFCGADLLAEDQIDASILLDTGLFPCFLALVGRPAQAPGGAQPRSLRVGSQYPLLAPRLLSEIGLEPDIRVFHGTAETWINLNAIDAAVDTWRTGATANANGLDLITVFRETAFVAAFLPSQTGLIDARSAAFVARFQEWLVGQHAGDDARVTAIRP